MKVHHIALGESLNIVGSSTGKFVTYCSQVGSKIVVSQDIKDVLRFRKRHLLRTEVCAEAISHLLHHGLIPLPLTAYSEIYGIAGGFSVTFSYGQTPVASCDFPFFNDTSTESSNPSTQTLLDELCRVLQANRVGEDGSVLMLSSGKDSTALALAAKECGYNNLLCVTYAASADDYEAAFAAQTSRNLGLRHHIQLPIRDSLADDDFATFWRRTPNPCVDPVQLPYALTLAHLPFSSSKIIDGMGNDIYAGHVPPPREHLKVRLARGGASAANTIRGSLHFTGRFQRLLSPSPEHSFFQGAWLRYWETRRFYDASVNTHEIWREDFKRREIKDYFDARAFYRGQHLDIPAAMGKARNAAEATGAVSLFPWADEQLAAYYFNLPTAHRFDRAARRNKVLLRRMLKDHSGYDAEKVGKHGFSFSHRQFLEENLRYFESEVMKCRLWNSKVGTVLQELSTQFKAGVPVEHAVITLAAVSMWHNHWIDGGLNEVE